MDGQVHRRARRHQPLEEAGSKGPGPLAQVQGAHEGSADAHVAAAHLHLDGGVLVHLGGGAAQGGCYEKHPQLAASEGVDGQPRSCQQAAQIVDAPELAHGVEAAVEDAVAGLKLGQQAPKGLRGGPRLRGKVLRLRPLKVLSQAVQARRVLSDEQLRREVQGVERPGEGAELRLVQLQAHDLADAELHPVQPHRPVVVQVRQHEEQRQLRRRLGARFTFTLPTVEQAGYVSPAASARPSSRATRRAEQLRILAVDDDAQALRYVRDTLMRSGYEPMVTADPGEALRLVEEYKPDLVLLDLVLPGTDGIDLMKDIAERRDVPVIFLSAYGQDKLVARAFDMGAADYVVKPFSPTELLARIRAALRRREVPKPSEPYMLGDLTIDYDERRVVLAGRPVELTAKEYGTLAELSTNAGRVLTYETLLRRVWGLDADADIRPMRTTINSIRRKLGDAAENPTYVFTQLRVGYRMPKGETQGQLEE